MHRGRTKAAWKQLGTRQQHRLPDAEIDGVEFSWPCPLATSKAIPILMPVKRGRDGRCWPDSEPAVLRRWVRSLGQSCRAHEVREMARSRRACDIHLLQGGTIRSG